MQPFQQPTVGTSPYSYQPTVTSAPASSYRNPYLNNYGQVYSSPQVQSYVPPNPPQENQNSIQGRIVANAEDITPNEVPMNGSVSIFPLADGSCILTKTWSNEGIIKTGLYVPYIPPQNNSEDQEEKKSFEDISAIILERLDKMEKMIAKNYKRPYNNGNKKKGVEQNNG